MQRRKEFGNAIKTEKQRVGEGTTESREQTGERAREASFATMQIKKREEESMIADNKAQIET